MKTKLLTFYSQLFFLCILMFALDFSIAAPQVSNQTSDCKPYSIPLDPVSCGPGYTGVKFPLKVKSCPSGVITTGQSFNTENCKRVGDNTDPNRTNCDITPSDVSCISKPAPLGCPPGQHWVTTGSGIAHCVQNDFPCPWGQSLQHDPLGNPYCVANTCPSNQVLQPDGISCACSAGLVWDGSICVAACTPSSSVETSSCSAGFTGTMSRSVTLTCPLGTPVKGAWDTSSCVPNVVSCPSDDYVPVACSSGSGTAYNWYSYIGASCTRTFMGVDESGCSATPPTCPSDTSFSSSCGAGFSGQQVTTTTYSGASCTPTNTVDRSLCTSVSNPICTVTTGSENGFPCPATYTGWVFRNWTQDSCTGRTYGDWDYGACVKDPVVCRPPETSLGSCPAGKTGNTLITTTYSGDSCTPSFSTDDSGCLADPPQPKCSANASAELVYSEGNEQDVCGYTNDGTPKGCIGVELKYNDDDSACTPIVVRSGFSHYWVETRAALFGAQASAREMNRVRP